MQDKQAFIREFQRQAVDFAGTIYRVWLTDYTEACYLLMCRAIDIADDLYPQDPESVKENGYSPEWSQIKNSFASLVEQTLVTKKQRGDIL